MVSRKVVLQRRTNIKKKVFSIAIKIWDSVYIFMSEQALTLNKKITLHLVFRYKEKKKSNKCFLFPSFIFQSRFLFTEICSAFNEQFFHTHHDAVIMPIKYQNGRNILDFYIDLFQKISASTGPAAAVILRQEHICRAQKGVGIGDNVAFSNVTHTLAAFA